MQILYSNIDISYQLNRCMREGFVYSTIGTRQYKNMNRVTHSLYENINEYLS